MKKVLALVLAVAMMSTVAFAASNTVFGSGYDKEPNNIPSGTSDIKGSYGPGEDFHGSARIWLELADIRHSGEPW